MLLVPKLEDPAGYVGYDGTEKVAELELKTDEDEATLLELELGTGLDWELELSG